MLVAHCGLAARSAHSAVEQSAIGLHEALVLVQDDQCLDVTGGQVLDKRRQARGPRKHLGAVSPARVIDRRAKIGADECLGDGLFATVRLVLHVKMALSGLEKLLNDSASRRQILP